MKTLEARVSSLESALRRMRVLAATLGTVLLLTALAAFVPQSQEQVTTRRLVLTDEQDMPTLILVASPEGGLAVQRPTGEEVFRVGGYPARLLNH